MKKFLKSSRQMGHDHIADEIRRQIHEGVLKPGDRLLSYNEMRDLYGAHSVAVQKVYEQLASEGLIMREHGRGTFVAPRQANPEPAVLDKAGRDEKADHAGKSTSGLIGVVAVGPIFEDFSPYWAKVLSGIRQVCHEAEMDILLPDFQSNRGWEKADGILLCDWSNQLARRFLPSLMPCVSFLVPSDGIASVYADDYQGGRLATEHLIEKGHRNIAYLHTYDSAVTGRRLAGYRDALMSAGIPVNETLMRSMRNFGGPEFTYGYQFAGRGREVMQDWINDGWEKTQCTAVIAQNDDTAIGVIEALRAHGLRVPEDVSVVGYDGTDSNQSQVLQVPASQSQVALPQTMQLTTVAVPLEEISKSATRLLLRLLKGETISEAHQVFPVSLVEGQSVSRVRR